MTHVLARLLRAAAELLEPSRPLIVILEDGYDEAEYQQIAELVLRDVVARTAAYN